MKHTASRLRRLFGAMAIDVTPLRASRDYRLLFIGQFVSAFGSAMSYVVLPWQMYQLTKSTLYVGLLGIAEFFPMFVLAFVGGALADAVDRRKLILFAEAGLAGCCAILTVNALLPEPRVWILFVGAACFAAINAIHRPALESLTPRLVAPEHLPAVSTLSSLRSFTFIVGPALAGLLAEHFGAALAFGLDCGTYLIAIVTLLLIRSITVPPNAGRPSLGTVLEGMHYARRRPELLGTYLIDINAMFFAMPIALFPALAESFGGASVGLFYSMMALGPLLVSLTSGWTTHVQRHGRAIVIAVVLWGVAIVAFGLVQHLWLALACLLVAGAADGVSGIFRMTIWNQTIPDRLRGRMAGIEMVSYLTGPYLGNAQVGFTASLLGPRIGVAWGGACCIAGAALLTACLPALWRYDAVEGVARKIADEAAAGSAGAPPA
ncbi:MFS transporter [Horticoccus sp. 23ND18S-11]|uniref:MFS transporter n=1 Tax=Horticoccus sp. 23ND18S-11 TaxID=3391832 RepID=UPI0039C9C882